MAKRRGHGPQKHVVRRPGYGSLRSAIDRCHNPNSKDFARYGGRGITVCDRWRDDPSLFFSDIGERPEGATLDRIDGSRGYEPGNCRWATWTEQARNRSNNKLEDHEPEQIRWLCSLGYKQAEIARFFEIDQSHVSRIVTGDRGMRAEVSGV